MIPKGRFLGLAAVVYHACMGHPVKITAPFATAERTAEVLGIAPKRAREIIALVDRTMAGGSPRRAAARKATTRKRSSVGRKARRATARSRR